MTNDELLAILNSAESSAVAYNSEFTRINERLLKDYLQQPYGDEVVDQSQVISPDVQNLVESDMSSLARVFLGAAPPLSFNRMTSNPREEQEVNEKNAYIDHLIFRQPWSYRVLFGWMKEAGYQQCSVVKYLVEETKKIEEYSYEDVDLVEIDEIMQSLKSQDVSMVEITGQEEKTESTYDIRFRATIERKEYKIINVPPEKLLISKNATCVADAELIGDRVCKTRGQLLAEGFKRSVVESLPAANISQNSNLQSIRNRDTGDQVVTESINEWASESVEISDLYVLVDFDGDGIAERRHILKSGNVILVNEVFNRAPYALLSCLLMPHKAIGRSRGQMVQQTQRVKTVVMRQTLDNMYMVNHPRNVIHPDVEIDDYLNVRPNGAIRLKKSTQIVPQNAIMPLVTPFMGDKSLMITQYLDAERAQATGVMMSNQGLDSDTFNNETAARFNGVRDDSKAKIELVARTFGETGFRELFEGMCWLVSQFQDSETEIMVLGKPLTVDPTKWRYSHHAISNVGLGSGDGSKQIEALQGIYAAQQQLKMSGSLLVDDQKLYNTLTDMTSALGFKSSQDYFNNPEMPQELLFAQNQLMQAQLQQMQMMLQQSQNPLAESEQIRAQAKLIEAQSRQQLEIAKLQEQIRQFDIETAQKANQHNQDLAVDLTKIEAQTNKNVAGSLI